MSQTIIKNQCRLHVQNLNTQLEKIIKRFIDFYFQFLLHFIYLKHLKKNKKRRPSVDRPWINRSFNFFDVF